MVLSKLCDILHNQMFTFFARIDSFRCWQPFVIMICVRSCIGTIRTQELQRQAVTTQQAPHGDEKEETQQHPGHRRLRDITQTQC